MNLSAFKRQRSFYLLAGLGLLISAIIPVFSIGRADAAIFAVRSIKMSDATPGATAVTYQVTITPQLAGANDVHAIVLEFCDNTPLDGDACTATAGTDVPNGASAAITGWTLDGVSDSNTLIFNDDGLDNQWTSGTPVTLNITGMVNPSNVNLDGSFYARFYSFADDAVADGYVSATPGAYTDFGGFALSTAAKLTITAKVMEKLTFCVYTLATCTLGGTSLVLGDANGVLDEATAYNNADAKFDIKTNAQGGAVVRAITYGAYNTLASGVNTITAIGGTGALSSVGDEQFGFCVDAEAGLTAVSPYTGVEGLGGTCASDLTTGAYVAGTAAFALDTTATATTYGDDIVNTGGAPRDELSGTLNFIGNIDVTTEAGIYTAQMGLIATGTF